MKKVQKALLDLALLKAQQKALGTQIIDAEKAVIDAMRATGQKTVSATLGSGDTVNGTLVEPQSVVIDEDRLKGVLGPKMWGKVTKAVLDKGALEARVAVGDIDANIVAGCSTLKDIKPSVRISGSYTPTDVDETIRAVAITDEAGRVKPAAKRLVKPRKP